MIETPAIVQTAEQHAAVVHVTVRRGEIEKAMGPAIQEVVIAIASQGMAPAGAFFAHHLRLDAKMFDFEAGFPIHGVIEPTGRVYAGTLPAARVARTHYVGPYDGLFNAWAEFNAWMKAEGLMPASDLWECYLVGPESGKPPTAYRTQLNRPLRA